MWSVYKLIVSALGYGYEEKSRSQGSLYFQAWALLDEMCPALPEWCAKYMHADLLNVIFLHNHDLRI